MQQQDYDIVIAGGGAIGAALALELAGLGFHLAMIEPRAAHFAPSQPERVIALTHGSRLHLERLGVWEGIAAAGFGRIGHVHISEPGNRGRVDLDAADAAGVAALGYVLEMADVLAPMYKDLAKAAALMSSARVTAVDPGPDLVRVAVAGEDGERRISTRLLIAADGTASPVRRMAGIDTAGWDHNRYALVASLSCAHGHGDIAYECFRPAGPLAFLPLADGRVSIVWTLPPREAALMLRSSSTMFLNRLEREAGPRVMDGIGPLSETGPRAVFPLELTLAKRMVTGRVIVAGNAAHTLHPVAGQGMNLGLRDVADLADILGSGGDPGARIHLEAYAQRRCADTAKVVGFTESLAAVFGSDMPPVRWARGWGMDTLQAASPLRDMLLRHASGIEQAGRGAKEMSIAG